MFSFLKVLDRKIDYVGQEFSLKLMYLILIAGYTVSFAIGLFKKDLTYTLVMSIGIVVFCFIVTVPSWPYFRRHPLKFKKIKQE